MKKPVILKAKSIYKTFQGETSVDVLKGLDCEICKGESLAIMGRSGEGKSTLLHILGTLEPPTSGSLYYLEEKLRDKDLPAFRGQKLGFIFQSFNLLDDYTVLENLLIPCSIARQTRKEKEMNIELALTLLEHIELLPKKNEIAKHLSGGEKQRVAIARALMCDPDILFADEPSGNLDSIQADIIHTLLLNLVKKYDKSLVVVTHDKALASLCDKILYLKEGVLWENP